MPKQDVARRYRAMRDRFADWLSGYRGEREAFESHHEYPLNLKNPQSFSEKLCWRKLYDRNPLLPVIVDKFAVREFARRLLGEQKAEELLIPLLFSTTDPATLPFDKLPEEYTVKANHGCGFNLIVRGRCRPKPEQIIELCRTWLVRGYGVELHEWAYQKMERRIIVETVLKSHNGKPPREYKFHMFDGQCAVIQALNSDAWYDGINHIGSKLPSLTYFTPEWSWLDVSWYFYWMQEQFPTDPTLPRPAALEEMLAIAEKLSRPFDYIRVDLYDTEDGIKLGELTPYHLTGHAKITPVEFDFELGQMWRQRHSRWRIGSFL